MNVAAALVLFLTTLPLWLFIALAIKLTSRGPIFYTQTRVGLNRRRSPGARSDSRRQRDDGGRPFRIIKFRTMRMNAEGGTGPVWAAPQDPRITLVGRFLREYRLDELPQLINVMRGEMNLVGPRPERPDIVADLRAHIPHYGDRQQVLPGITGHAQVNLQYDSSVDDVKRKVEYDLEYAKAATVWADLRIMIQTIPVILFRRGSR